MGGHRKRPTPKGASRADRRLPAEALRWSCDTGWLEFGSTAEVEPITGVIGQEDAIEALRFGLESHSPGQNIFVRGLAGTGRMTLLRQLVEEIKPSCPVAHDRCYVRNFSQRDRPRLITLPRGRGLEFRARVEELIRFITGELGPILSSDPVRSRRGALNDRLQEQVRQLGKPFEEELRASGLVLVPVQAGQALHPAILPLVDGKPVPPARFEELRSAGTIDDAAAEDIHRKIETFGKRLEEVSGKLQEIQAGFRASLQQLYESEARAALTRVVFAIDTDFRAEGVQEFLKELVDDLIANHLTALDENQGKFTRLYSVNVVLAHAPDEPCPVIMENAPTLQNLLGAVEREVRPGGTIRSDHLMIQAGSLLRADRGFLILEARDVLTEPGAWKVLVRTLRTGKLEIAPAELVSFLSGPLLKPEPIDIDVKVVLLGDPELFYLLDAYDPDFPQLFKVLADFDTTIARDERSVRCYAGVLARIAREECLPALERDAVAALVEHGARIAARHDRLTTKFGRIADVAREAAFLARKRGGATIQATEVWEAVRKSKHRADLPARHFRKQVADGTIRIQVGGREVGQVNGLALIQAGPMTYGFPTRITATIGPGTAGAINIEREAELSGSIHTKGFYILGGLLRHLLRTRHPLAFSASIAFEQSYGGIDGDSASAAEGCCLLSALTGFPLRQDLAMTGAVDQLGHVQAVGAVTEKVEGFFDACNDLGLTGSQGVIIPRANAGDLMLRPDVVEACRRGQFHVYAVETLLEALEILTGREAGQPDARGRYPPHSVLHAAEHKAFEYWKMASASFRGKNTAGARSR